MGIIGCGVTGPKELRVRDIDAEAISTDELVDLARRQCEAWTRAAVALLPEDAARVDAHTHGGVDVDGSRLDEAQLLAQLDAAGIHHAACTPLQQASGYVAENERIRELATASRGRLLALHRCDPRALDPAADARAGLDAGAVGLKWHPRAEQFSMLDDVARDTAAVAGEAGVPILIHAGRGMERLGEGVVELARTHARATFILAHAAVSDLAWIVDATRDMPNLVFDTSWWRPTDIAVLLTSIEPDRVLHGSDPPYGTVGLGLQVTARIARACGWDDDSMALLFGGNARRVFGIDDAPAPTAVAACEAHYMPVEEPAFRRSAELLAAAVQTDFAEGASGEPFDLAEAALHVHSSHDRAHDAALLLGALRVGRALLERDRKAGDHEEAAGFRVWSPTRRRGVELLIATLAHLSTPALQITGIDRVGWDDPAPFV
jgi:predicted TIM-barrel fold metal-dependent hydrolase